MLRRVLSMVYGSTESTHPNLFNIFPDEVKLYIFSYLTGSELCVLALVSWDIKSMAMDDSLWMKFFVKVESQPEGTLSYPPPARVCHSAVVYGGKMYVYGGHVPDALNYIRDVKNDFHSYHFGTRQWSVIEPDPKEEGEPLPLKTEHTSVVYENCMYLFGGYSDSNKGYSDVSIYEYNFDTRTCARVPAAGKAPRDRSAHTAVVYGDAMYVLGGWDGTVSNIDFFSFNFKTKTWNEVEYFGTPPPCVRSHATVVYKDSMVVFGGFGETTHGENIHPTSIFMYHFLEKRWEVVNPSVPPAMNTSMYPPKKPERGKSTSSPLMAYPNLGPCGRSRFRMVYSNESLWVVGGWDRKSYFADLWRFRLDTMTWHKVDASFELRGVGQHSLVVSNGCMYPRLPLLTSITR